MTLPAPVDLREKILEEAARLFVTRGYRGISMREIAEGVGISKAGLYYHFADKEDLLLAILNANLDHAANLTDQAVNEGQTSREQITALLRALFNQAPEQRALIRLASQEMSHLGDEARLTCVQRYQEKFIDPIADILRAGVERGELRPMNPHLATWLLLGMAYPFFYPAHGWRIGSLDEALDLMLSVFFEGAAAGQR